MVRLLALVTIVAALCASAVADEVVLKDGRTFNGAVSVRDHIVMIRLSYGTISFPRSQVVSIKLQPTSEDEFNRRLARIGAKDTANLFELAKWARENSMEDKADDLHARILKIDPNNAAVHKAMGQVWIDKQWHGFESAMELARGKLEAGRYDSLLTDVLPAIAQVAPKGSLLAVKELTAQAQLRSAKFALAKATFEELARKAPAPASNRYSVIVDILNDNRDGMYIVKEPYPGDGPLLGGQRRYIPIGPATLTHPLVLEKALLDRAYVDLKAGKALMADASKLDATDPDAAAGKYTQAAKAFDRAEAIVPRIALSNRMEIARRRISALRKDIETDARKFDVALANLGKKEMTPQAYRSMVIRMRHDLDNTRDGLKSVLEIAKPYPRDLVLEISWAQQDLKKVQSMRDILTAELNEGK